MACFFVWSLDWNQLRFDCSWFKLTHPSSPMWTYGSSFANLHVCDGQPNQTILWKCWNVSLKRDPPKHNMRMKDNCTTFHDWPSNIRNTHKSNVSAHKHHTKPMPNQHKLEQLTAANTRPVQNKAKATNKHNCSRGIREPKCWAEKIITLYKPQTKLNDWYLYSLVVCRYCLIAFRLLLN